MDFKNLCLELRGAEAIYATLVTADLYPHKRGYFRTRHFQYGTFAKAVENECYFITGHRPALTSKKPNTVFKLEEEVILEMHMTDGEVDTLIGNIELELISRYQEILQYDNLPIFTKSILASQAEELNNQWRKLQMNLKIEAQR
jgi:hypothetical protein